MSKEDTLSRILDEQKKTNERLEADRQAKEDARLAEEFLRPFQQRLADAREQYQRTGAGVYVGACEKYRKELIEAERLVKSGAYRDMIPDDTPAGRAANMERQIEALRTEENELAVHLMRYPNDTDAFGKKNVVSRQRRILEVDLAKYRRQQGLD